MQHHKHSNRIRLRSSSGFTLIEGLIVVVVIGLLIGFAVPEIVSAISESRGSQCAANLRQFEAAKDAFVSDNPGQSLSTTNQIMPYLRYGFPKCPSGGAYTGHLNVHGNTTCSVNGTSADVQKGTVTANGFHDLAPR